MSKMTVLDQNITISLIKDEDYISLTDIARYKDNGRTDDLIRNWLRNRNTIEFLGIWEHLYNPDFKPVEFDGVCLSNLENLNAVFITEGVSQQERLERLNQIAIHQMTLLAGDEQMKLPGDKK